MKKKTVLSTVTLFFLLQSSPLRADNFFWSLFTSPVTPYALLVGFWGFVKAISTLGLDYGRFERHKDNNIRNADEHAQNRLDISLQRSEYLTARVKQNKKECKREYKSTKHQLENSEELVQETDEKFSHLRQNHANYLIDHLKKEHDNLHKEIKEHGHTVKLVIDTSNKQVINGVLLKLQAEKEKQKKEDKKIKAFKKNIENKIFDLDEDNKKHLNTIERLTPQVNAIGESAESSIEASNFHHALIKEKNKLIKQVKKSYEENNNCLYKVQGLVGTLKPRSIDIDLPTFQERTKELLYNSKARSALLLNN